MRYALPLILVVVVLLVAGCGSGSYSPPPASKNGSEGNLMRSERGAPAKRSKREDPVPTYSRP